MMKNIAEAILSTRKSVPKDDDSAEAQETDVTDHPLKPEAEDILQAMTSNDSGKLADALQKFHMACGGMAGKDGY